MPKETDFLQPKLTLAELGIQLMASKLFQNNSQMLGMLFFTTRVDQDVINEDDDKLSNSSMNTWFIKFMKYVGALLNPKDITVNSYWP
jgi:hypothetical protein